MVRIDCSGTLFGSYLDEKHLFTWAEEIPGFLRWDRDTLVVRSNLSEASLRDLIALLSRYRIPLRQLRVFLNPKNRAWFADSKKYWHKEVFARQPNLRLEPTGARSPRHGRAAAGAGSSSSLR